MSAEPLEGRVRLGYCESGDRRKASHSWEWDVAWLVLCRACHARHYSALKGQGWHPAYTDLDVLQTNA